MRVEISGYNRSGEYVSRIEIVMLGNLSFTAYALARGWDYVADGEYMSGSAVIVVLRY